MPGCIVTAVSQTGNLSIAGSGLQMLCDTGVQSSLGVVGMKECFTHDVTLESKRSHRDTRWVLGWASKPYVGILKEKKFNWWALKG